MATPPPLGRIVSHGYNDEGIWCARVAGSSGYFPMTGGNLRVGQLVWVNPRTGRLITKPPVPDYEVIDLDGSHHTWILADLRNTDQVPGRKYWHIHSPTTSKNNLDDSIRWVADRRGSPFMVFQAKTRGKVHDWMLANGCTHQFNSTWYPATPTRGEIMPRLNIEALDATIERLTRERDRLEMMPEEPEGLREDGTNVIAWDARFGSSGIVYSYAARKAGDGLWYTTGPRSEQGYTWEALIRWIADKAIPVDGSIWTAQEFEAVPVP